MLCSKNEWVYSSSSAQRLRGSAQRHASPRSATLHGSSVPGERFDALTLPLLLYLQSVQSTLTATGFG